MRVKSTEAAIKRGSQLSAQQGAALGGRLLAVGFCRLLFWQHSKVCPVHCCCAYTKRARGDGGFGWHFGALVGVSLATLFGALWKPLGYGPHHPLVRVWGQACRQRFCHSPLALVVSLSITFHRAKLAKVFRFAHHCILLQKNRR